MTKVKLLRSNDRMLGGVCAGFARYLNINPLYLRLIMVVFGLFCYIYFGLYSACALLIPAYGLCWIFIPNEPKEIGTHDSDNIISDNPSVEGAQKSILEKSRGRKISSRVIVIIILLGISPSIFGFGALLFGEDELMIMNAFTFFTLPAALVIIVLYVIAIQLKIE